MKRGIAILMFLLLCASGIAGCTSSPSSSVPPPSPQPTGTTAPTTAAAATEAAPLTAEPVKPVTLTLWIHEGYTDHIGRWGKDPISKYIQEKTGITFDIQTGDGTNDDTKLNLMITSHQMPDMLNVAKMLPASYTLQKEGVVEDIEKLAQQYKCPNILRLISESNDINLKYNRFKDGNYWGGPDAPLYVWPDYFVDKYTYEHDRLNTIQERDCFIARKDIYEDMGSPDLSNLDNFTKFLKDVRDKGYKDVNGSPIKVLGLQQGNMVDSFTAIFTGDNQGIVQQTDNTIINNFEQPGYKQAILYLAMLYREGILDQELYTETYDQWVEKLRAGGVGTVWVYYWHVDGANTALKDTKMTYWPVAAEKTPRADSVTKLVLNHGWAIGVGFGWRCNYISTTCKDKEAAINFLDFMYSHEGEMLQWYGLPGQFYEPAEAWDESNLPKLQDKEMGVKQTQYGIDYNNEKGNDAASESGMTFWMFWNIHGYSDFAGGGNDANQDEYTLYARQQVQKLSDYNLEWCKFNDVSGLTVSDPQYKAIADSVTQIKNKWLPLTIMAKDDAEASGNFDKMLAEMKTAGLETLDKAYLTTYEQKMVPLMK